MKLAIIMLRRADAKIRVKRTITSFAATSPILKISGEKTATTKATGRRMKTQARIVINAVLNVTLASLIFANLKSNIRYLPVDEFKEFTKSVT